MDMFFRWAHGKKFDLLNYSIQDFCSFFKTNSKIIKKKIHPSELHLDESNYVFPYAHTLKSHKEVNRLNFLVFT